jgi:hypothetical protein
MSTTKSPRKTKYSNMLLISLVSAVDNAPVHPLIEGFSIKR